MSKENGGPAFPSVGEGGFGHPQYSAPGMTLRKYSAPGMSLRDYFAAKAMQSMLLCDKDDIPRRAYAVADAMLEERRK